MRQKRRVLCLLTAALLVLLGLCGAGCGRSSSTADFYVYYLNQEFTALEPLGYEPEAALSDTEAILAEIFAVLDEGSDRVEYQRIYPESVTWERYECVGNILSVYFTESYYDLDSTREVLARAALCQTMLQLEGVNGLLFYVGDDLLRDANGDAVGLLMADSFLANPGEDINDIMEMELTLYFASADGSGLVRETQTIRYYSSNISTEKLVMEQLLKGPESEEAQSALPENTGLISVSVLDGACVVNLDDNFLSQNYDIQEAVVIYSIVNSLAELSTVETVQITVNGNNNMIYRQEMSLSDYYTMNEDLVVDLPEEVGENQSE